MNAVIDNDNLLELILFQLDGEAAGMLAQIAAAEGLTDAKGELMKSVPQAAQNAHAAALATRLVCRRWKAHSGFALANTRIRIRLLTFQDYAAFYYSVGLPIGCDDTVTPSAFLVKAFENSLKRVAGANPDVAIGQIRQLLEYKVLGRFVIYTAHHKVASWQRRLRQQLPGTTTSVYATNDDLGSMQRLWPDQSEIAVISYVIADNEAFMEPHSTMLTGKNLKYVIFDDARRYMWRPNLYHIFHPTKKLLFGGDEGLLLDDFHTRPCTLAELFTLVFLTFGKTSDLDDEDVPGVHLQAYLMEVFDPFNFSEAVVDRLLRPQLMAAVRHAMCGSH